MSIKSEFCHSLKYSNCYIATQFSQFSNTSDFHKMQYSQYPYFNHMIIKKKEIFVI